MINWDWANALHSKAVWTTLATAIVGFIVALGVPLSASQQATLHEVLGGLFLTALGSIYAVGKHVASPSPDQTALGVLQDLQKVLGGTAPAKPAAPASQPATTDTAPHA